MGAMRLDRRAQAEPSSRWLGAKESLRASLYVRIPQTGDVVDPDEELDSPDSPDSSGSEDGDVDSSDSEDDEEDEEGEDEEVDDGDDEEESGGIDEGADEILVPVIPPDDTDRPSLPTLTHAPDPSDDPLPTTNSIISSLPTTTFLTVTSEVSRPIETDISESIVASSTTASPETTTTLNAEETSNAEGNVASDESNANSGDSNRGADIGIIIGTLALASLLVVAAVFFYRWHLSRKNKAFAEISEKGPPPPRDSDFITYMDAVTARQEQELQRQRGLNHYSSWAAFDPNPTAQGPMSYGAGEEKFDEDARQMVDPIRPPPPVVTTVYHKPYRREEDHNGISPPDSPTYFQASNGQGIQKAQQVHVTRASTGQPLGLYPPGTFRQSFARTEVTNNTEGSAEGTWRTWGVDQARPTQGNKTWKERYMG